MAQKDVYEKFIQWLNTNPMGVPDTEADKKLIMARYTPEDAELLEIHVLPKDEVFCMARAGKITDGISALTLFLCESHL